MGLEIRLVNIETTNSFTVFYKTGSTLGDINTGFSSYGGVYPASTTQVVVSGVTLYFETQYWFKIVDQVTNNYTIQNIKTHTSSYYVGPTPTPTSSATSTPLPTSTPVSTSSPTSTPSPTSTSVPTPTPTPTYDCGTLTVNLEYIVPTPTPTPTVDPCDGAPAYGTPTGNIQTVDESNCGGSCGGDCCIETEYHDGCYGYYYDYSCQPCP